MKHLFVALLCSLCWIQGWADSLPLNQYDKKLPSPQENHVYARFRAFSAPKQDKDGAYVLGEFTIYNEGTSYYVLDGHLYLNWSNVVLFHIMPMKPLPVLESFQFWEIDANGYADKFLSKAQIPEMDGRNFTLSCGENSFVQFTEKAEPGKPGMESDLYYLITWTENGKTHTFTREETSMEPLDFPPGRFAFCDGNILYFDGEDWPYPARGPRHRGIFFYDLKNRRRGVYSARLYERDNDAVFYPYNPIGIPGTDWMLYLKGNFEKGKDMREQVVVRKRLTQEQADQAARDYQLWHESLKQTKTGK